MVKTVKEKILEKALEMFLTQGIKVVRMDDIACELGMSKRTIYENISDKKSLVKQALELFDEQNYNRKAEQRGEYKNIFEGFVKALEVQEKEFDQVYRLRFEMKRYYPEIQKVREAKNMKRHMELFKTGILAGVDQGLISHEVNIDFVVFLCNSILTQAILNEEAELPKGMSRFEALCTMFFYIFRGIATNEGLCAIDSLIERYEQSEKQK